MKLAVAGKGGVGKTTIVALLAREAARRGYRVLAVDADPDANLATALGFPEPVAPLANEEELVAERAGSGGFVRLNPTVDDIPDRYAVEREGIRLLVLGGIRGGGQGCACPANVLLKSLLAHLLLAERDVVLLDMEAGIEHLGRGTVRGVDALLLVVESDRKTLETARRTVDLARQIGIQRILAVVNRIHDDDDLPLVRAELPSGIPILEAVPYLDSLRVASRRGPVHDDVSPSSVSRLFERLEAELVPREARGA